MPVFYRGRRALITEHVFETVHVARLQFSISKLAEVHIIRCPGPERGGRFLGLSALLAALLIVPIVGLELKVVAAAAGLFLIGSMRALRRRAPVRWKLAATYDGQLMTLFESEDQTEFDQVCRGLRRALERSADNP
ncbi:DUF6232 family protein [Actinoplanes solisilvae]|uniref:DUF6232 family protein n=1 Tax=Actinoplanes solisilvae TaxID=2486853 RepID=UPI000FD88AC7|nr:DUF6232 family protein [Actinoplanes solisilvae]